MTIQNLKLNELVLSPLNMRTNVKDATDIEQLAASISEVGLLQPLVVHKMPKGKKYGVIAGGRRLRAMESIRYKDLIPCQVREGTDAALIADSVTENFARLDARPYEIYAAFKAMQNNQPALDASDMARIFGIDDARAKRILRLAHLHPEVFESYRTGKIDDNAARAFAATEDQELQLAIFKAGDTNEYRIRQALRVGHDRAALEKVGRDVYEAAGGKLEQDLFSDNVRVLDTDLLARLRTEQQAKQREDLIAEYPNVVWSEAYPGGNEYSMKAQSTRIYREIEKDAKMLGVIALDYSGDYKASFYTLEEGEKAPELTDKEKPEVSGRALNYMKGMRNDAVVRGIFDSDTDGENAKDAHLALIHSMARSMFTTSSRPRGYIWNAVGALYQNTEYASPYSVENGDWLSEPDDVRSFMMFKELTPRQVDEVAAYIWGRKVDVGERKPGRRTVPEWLSAVRSNPFMLRRVVDMDEKFFELFNKKQIIGFFEEALGDKMSQTFRDKLGKMKLDSVRQAAVTCLNPYKNGSDSTMRLLGLSKHYKELDAWVPKWLRFDNLDGMEAPIERHQTIQELADEADEIEEEDARASVPAEQSEAEEKLHQTLQELSDEADQLVSDTHCELLRQDAA